MAERSQFWDTAGAVGDGADTYGAAQLREMLRAVWTPQLGTSEGVLAGYGGGLAVSGSSTPLSVSAGCALVSGIYYQNTAPVNVTVPTPSAGTTKHRVVVQALWGSTATARLALISSADGTNSYPSLTQQDNSRWEIALAGVTVDTAGSITLEDQRDYCHMATALVHRRRGGSSSSWNSGGSTNYIVGGARIQSGVATLTWDDNDQSDTKVVTFPVAYSQKPLVFLTLLNAANSQKRTLLATVESVSATSVTLRGQRTDGAADLITTADVQWTAIGPI